MLVENSQIPKNTSEKDPKNPVLRTSGLEEWTLFLQFLQISLNQSWTLFKSRGRCSQQGHCHNYMN